MIWIRDISFASIVIGLSCGYDRIKENKEVWRKPDKGFVASVICVIVGCIHYCFYDCKIVGLFVITEGILMSLASYESDKDCNIKITDPTLKLSHIEYYLWMIGYIIYGICLLIGFEI